MNGGRLRKNRELASILEYLPEDKAGELLDFARFLVNQYAQMSPSGVDEGALLLQQKTLSRIWDNPGEDLYEL